MCKFLTHLLTGPDNATFDIARVLWAIGVMSFLALALWNTFGLHNAPDLVSYGAGFGAVLVAGGAGVGFKGNTEPKP